MELVNHTPFPALLFRTAVDEDRIAASILARVTFELRNGAPRVAEQQVWPVSPVPWTSEQGPMDADATFYKGGVDLFVFGHARPTIPKATVVEVSIEIGDFTRRLLVFGPRVWYRKIASLLPTAPLPFDSIPLTFTHAFGGKDLWDGLEIPFPDNPDGMGFYYKAEHAEDRPLPHIEEPDQRINAWNDWPMPAGVVPCSPGSGLRLRKGLRVREDGTLAALDATFFNAAHPRMIAPSIAPGAAVRLSGVSHSGPLVFKLPRLTLFARLRFGSLIDERDLSIDQVGVEVDMQRFFVSYRFPFRYVVRQEELRSCELLLRI